VAGAATAAALVMAAAMARSATADAPAAEPLPSATVPTVVVRVVLADGRQVQSAVPVRPAVAPKTVVTSAGS
jgi:hypothetical protein